LPMRPKEAGPPESQGADIPHRQGAGRLLECPSPQLRPIMTIGDQQRAPGAVFGSGDDLITAIAVKVCCDWPQPTAAIAHPTPGSAPEKPRCPALSLGGRWRLEGENL